MLLVEVQAAGINYADVLARSGQYPAITKAPFALGFEIAGVVQEVGENVEGFKVGDPVAALTLTGGGYASHVLVPVATAIPFPKQLDPALAAGGLLQGRFLLTPQPGARPGLEQRLMAVALADQVGAALAGRSPAGYR